MHLTVSKDGTILNVVNPQPLGYGVEQLLGKNVSLLVPHPWKSQHDAMMGFGLARTKPHTRALTRARAGCSTRRRCPTW